MPSVFISPTSPVQKQANTSAQGIISGGGIHNNSLTPGAGQAKTQNNLNQTVTGTKIDNKTVGTNAGRQSVQNWLSGNTSVFAKPKTATTFNLPASAPLSESARVKQELIDDYNYNEFAKRTNEAIANIGANGNATAAKNYSLGDIVNGAVKYAAGDVDARVNEAIAQAGYNPGIDYESAIDKYLDANPVLNAENVAQLENLLAQREAKMNANPELDQYRNSNATNRAHSALEEYNSKETINDAYAQQREDYLDINKYIDEDIALMKEQAQRERDNNIGKAEADALEQRRNLIAMAPIADLALQERLSSMGLSMGANNTSGYSETARLQNQLATNNQIAQNYAQLEQAKTDYNNAYLDALTEAHRSGLAQKIDVRKLIADIGPEAALAIIENDQYWNDFGLKQDEFAETKRMNNASIESMNIQNDLNKQSMQQAAEKYPYELAMIKDEATRSAIDTSMYKDVADANLYNLYLTNVGKEQANTLGEIDVRVAAATADKLIEATLAEYGITIEQLNQMYKTNPLEVESMIADIAYKKSQTADVGRSSSGSGGGYYESLFGGGDPVAPQVGGAKISGNNEKLSLGMGPMTDSYYDYLTNNGW